MRYRIYANGKFVGYGHAADVMIAQLQYGKENVIAEKI